jgi:site-specific DNA-methyltransferase (adenine-specific)
VTRTTTGEFGWLREVAAARAAAGEDVGVIDLSAARDYVVRADNMDVLPRLPDGAFQLVYLDPPFNTGASRLRRTLRSVRDSDGGGDRTGFRGHRYTTEETGRMAYPDSFADYAEFIGPRLEEARRLLSESGTLYFHIDWREAHYCKVLLDEVFGRENFLNEVIWAYDFGGRAKDRWPAKHDTILVYVKKVGAHLFDQDAIERVPYLAPTLVGPEKAARGKLPTDVWWHTIVPTGGREKTGYPNQKPEGVLRRILQPSSRPGDRVLDFFAGSGTTGAVAASMGRRFVLVDANPEAVEVMRRRLDPDSTTYLEGAGLAPG